VVVAAVERGYFGPNSNVTLDDIAEEMGLSTSSVWEHLSKAKKQVFADVVPDADTR
jgi:predicted DNA binding protein